MIWEELKKGIQFERTNIFVPWNTKYYLLNQIGQPYISVNGDETSITWKDQSLLDGIKGNWQVSYFSYEKRHSINRIFLFYSGDLDANNQFVAFKVHLLKHFGNPYSIKEDDTDTEVIWKHGNLVINLSLIERHSYRCTLSLVRE